MTDLSITVKGTKELTAALKKMSKEAGVRVDKAINATGLELRGEIVKGYNEGGKVGVVYEKYNPRRTHRASEEGQAPASDTGRLANSVVFNRTKSHSASVGTNLDYGFFLEFGTQDIAPRPLWVPEVVRITPKYLKRMETALWRSMP